jgi:hypothetical protein
MIIINDHGSLDVLVDNIFFSFLRQIYSVKKEITKLVVVNSRLGLRIQSFGIMKKRELIDID